MYLTIDTTRYAVLAANLDGDIRYTVDKPPSAVSGTVTLCADDGTAIRTDNTADYLHPRVTAGVIILSNTPEPVPVTPPVPTTPVQTPYEKTALALAELAETQQSQDTENKLALAELAEAMTGGSNG